MVSFLYSPPASRGERVCSDVALPEGKILEFIYVYKKDSVLPEINCSIASIYLNTEKK